MPIWIVVPGVFRNCSLETGSLVFAICKCVITSLTSFTLAIYSLMYGYDGPQYGLQQLPYDLITYAKVGIIAFFVLAFSFSALLAKGLIRNRPALVKVYLLYGLTILMGCLVTSVTLFIMTGESDHVKAYSFSATIITCVSIVYAAILLMILATYRKLLDVGQYKLQEY